MYETVYSMIAAMSRVQERPLAPTQRQLNLLVTNMGLIRVGTSVRLDKARIRSIALGKAQPDLEDNLHFKQVDKILGEIFNAPEAECNTYKSDGTQGKPSLSPGHGTDGSTFVFL